MGGDGEGSDGARAATALWGAVTESPAHRGSAAAKSIRPSSVSASIGTSIASAPTARRAAP